MKPETIQAAIDADETGAIAAAIEQRIARARGWETDSPVELVVEDLLEQPLNTEEKIYLARAIVDSLGLPLMDEKELPSEDDRQCIERRCASRKAWEWMLDENPTTVSFDIAAFKPNQQDLPVEEWEFYRDCNTSLLRRFISTVFLRPEALLQRRNGVDIVAATFATFYDPMRPGTPKIIVDPRMKLLRELADL